MIEDRVTKPIASGTCTIAVVVIEDRVTKPIASGTCTIAVVVIEDRVTKPIASGTCTIAVVVIEIVLKEFWLTMSAMQCIHVVGSTCSYFISKCN